MAAIRSTQGKALLKQTTPTSGTPKNAVSPPKPEPNAGAGGIASSLQKELERIKHANKGRESGMLIPQSTLCNILTILQMTKTQMKIGTEARDIHWAREAPCVYCS